MKVNVVGTQGEQHHKGVRKQTAGRHIRDQDIGCQSGMDDLSQIEPDRLQAGLAPALSRTEIFVTQLAALFCALQCGA